ncbi:hypothetical protein [Evansella clarkii]|uniref:hypothetical protein n=1 Tax=Evansella clarkii TaxID=79879 RepID=UPI0009977950|nr:hypothetical protein [Evansella clarkii]
MFLYFLIYIVPIVLAVAWSSRNTENRKEEALLLKLAGYYFLGTFILWFWMIPLPAGLAAAFFLFRKAENKRAKKQVAITGFAVALISQVFIF